MRFVGYQPREYALVLAIVHVKHRLSSTRWFSANPDCGIVSQPSMLMRCTDQVVELCDSVDFCNSVYVKTGVYTLPSGEIMTIPVRPNL